jgi:urease accessory protein
MVLDPQVNALLPMIRLLQLASPTLPVGAYSYSQGLERAVEDGIVTNEHSAASWVEDALCITVGAFEGPMLNRMLEAAGRRDISRLRILNAEFLASRESAELRAESVQMGHSLARLLGEIEEARPALDLVQSVPGPAYPCSWSCAAAAFALPPEQAYAAYLWAWAENQVMAAVKLVPLGQSAGQRMLLRLGTVVAKLAAGPIRSEDSWTNFAPGLALASCLHETQYTRLFRS